MQVNRRQILFGTTFAGLAGGAASEAAACSREIIPPWTWRFWQSRFYSNYTLPRQERAAAEALVEAILHGSREQLDAVLAPDALLLWYPLWQAEGRLYDRAATIEHLSNHIAREGDRSFAINYFAQLPTNNFLLDATMKGYGSHLAKAPGGERAMKQFSTCGEAGLDWTVRFVCKLQMTESPYSRPEPVKVSRIFEFELVA